MSVNGWNPRLNAFSDVLSGNAGIWLTRPDGSRQIAAQGTTPVWAAYAPVWNNNDGTSQFNGTLRIIRAYNAYVGRDDGYWAGADLSGDGRVDLYYHGIRAAEFHAACCPRMGGGSFLYLTPYQSSQRSLIYDNKIVVSGTLMNAAISADAAVTVYQTATGTYTRKVWLLDGRDISVRDNEDPAAAFIGPDAQPWVVTVTPTVGVLVRPCLSAFGYQVLGDLYNLDARMFNGQLRIVGSTAAGALRDVWIDFNAARVDLRLL